MGCEKFQITPGILSSSRFMAAMSRSLSWPNTGRHFSFGSKSTKYSVSREPRSICAIVRAPDLGDNLQDLEGRKPGLHELCPRFALSVGPVLGARVPRTQAAPSSRCGKNSRTNCTAEGQINCT